MRSLDVATQCIAVHENEFSTYVARVPHHLNKVKTYAMREFQGEHLQDFKLAVDLLVLRDLQVVDVLRVSPHGGKVELLVTDLAEWSLIQN